MRIMSKKPTPTVVKYEPIRDKSSSERMENFRSTFAREV